MPPSTPQRLNKPGQLSPYVARNPGPPSSDELRLVRRILARAGYDTPPRPDPS